MSVYIQISLDTKSRAYLSQLAQAPVAAQRSILKAIDLENQITVGSIQKTKLSQRGPNTLGVITNRLRGSIRASKAVITSGGDVTSSIGSSVVYAGIHEFGFEGNVTVRAHTRRIQEFAMGTGSTAVFNPKTGRITKAKPKAQGPRTVQVRSHDRHINVRARAFISRTIQERSQAYTIAIGTAVSRDLSQS